MCVSLGLLNPKVIKKPDEINISTNDEKGQTDLKTAIFNKKELSNYLALIKTNLLNILFNHL